MKLQEAVYISNEDPEFLARMEARKDPEIILRTDEIDREIFRLIQEKNYLIEEKTKELLPKYEKKVNEALGIVGQALSFETCECWYPRE